MAESGPPGPPRRHALPLPSRRARVLDRPGHRPLHVPTTSTASSSSTSATARCSMPWAPAMRSSIASSPRHLLLRASPAGGQGARHRLRARPEGYRQLDEFVQAALADKRPSDGYFVEFWRLLVEWPEIIDLGPALRRRQARGARRSPRRGESACGPACRSASTSSTSTRSTPSSAPRAATPTSPRRPISSRSWSTTTAAASATPTSSATSARPSSATCRRMSCSASTIIS